MFKTTFPLTSVLLLIAITGCGSSGPIGTAQEECLANCDIKTALDCEYEDLSDADCRLMCEGYITYDYTQACLDAEAAYYHCLNRLDYECGNLGALPPISQITVCSSEMDDTSEFCYSTESE